MAFNFEIIRVLHFFILIIRWSNFRQFLINIYLLIVYFYFIFYQAGVALFLHPPFYSSLFSSLLSEVVVCRRGMHLARNLILNILTL